MSVKKIPIHPIFYPKGAVRPALTINNYLKRRGNYNFKNEKIYIYW